MQCRLNQEKYLRKYSVKKHKEKPDRVYLAYKKVDNNRIEKEKRKVANDYLTQTFHRLCFTYLSPYTTIILYLFIGGLHMEDKQLVAELKKKYIENPPEGMTPELVKNMSDSDLLDMSYFLSEGDYDDEYDDEGFFIF